MIATVPAPASIEVTYRAAITPLGAVTVMVLRLERALHELGRADRARVVGQLRDLLADLDA